MGVTVVQRPMGSWLEWLWMSLFLSNNEATTNRLGWQSRLDTVWTSLPQNGGYVKVDVDRLSGVVADLRVWSSCSRQTVTSTGNSGWPQIQSTCAVRQIQQSPTLKWYTVATDDSAQSHVTRPLAQRTFVKWSQVTLGSAHFSPSCHS